MGITDIMREDTVHAARLQADDPAAWLVLQYLVADADQVHVADELQTGRAVFPF
jgi:hypothetical protein